MFRFLQIPRQRMMAPMVFFLVKLQGQKQKHIINDFVPHGNLSTGCDVAKDSSLNPKRSQTSHVLLNILNILIPAIPTPQSSQLHTLVYNFIHANTRISIYFGEFAKDTKQRSNDHINRQDRKECIDDRVKMSMKPESGKDGTSTLKNYEHRAPWHNYRTIETVG